MRLDIVPGVVHGFLQMSSRLSPALQATATIAAELCRKLYAGGVRHFHFYTLNRAELSYAIAHLLGARARGVTQEAAA